MQLKRYKVIVFSRYNQTKKIFDTIFIKRKKKRNAKMTGEDKVFRKTTRKKQMSLIGEHTLETEIVAPPFFLFHREKFKQ